MNFVLWTGIFLIFLGILGAILKRNIISILISLEVGILGVLLVFFVASQISGAVGQVVMLFIMAIAAAEAAIGLALSIGIFRMVKGVDVDKLNELKE